MGGDTPRAQDKSDQTVKTNPRAIWAGLLIALAPGMPEWARWVLFVGTGVLLVLGRTLPEASRVIVLAQRSYDRSSGPFGRVAGKVASYPLTAILALATVLMLASVGGQTWRRYEQRRLSNVAIGDMPTPPSSFSWATNGSVSATSASPTESGDRPAIKLEMTLRGDKPSGDAGWGLELLKEAPLFILRNRYDYDQWFATKHEISLFIKGARGGERLGVSLKSDRVEPSPSAAGSDEERVVLSQGIETTWKEVRIPLDRFFNADRGRLRNVAFYVDQNLAAGALSQVVFLRDVTFR
jgi:hypothetical protein